MPPLPPSRWAPHSLLRRLACIYQQYCFPSNAPLPQLLSNLSEVAPTAFDANLRLQQSISDQRHQQRKIWRKSILRLRAKIAEALQTRIRRPPEVSKRKRCWF